MVHPEITTLAKNSETIFQIMWFAALITVLWGMLVGHSVIPRWVHQNDKIAHFFAFGALAGMAHGAWPSLNLATIWLMIVGLGLLTEGAQHLTIQHRFCWRDAVANSLGAGCVLALLHVWA